MKTNLRLSKKGVWWNVEVWDEDEYSVYSPNDEYLKNMTAWARANRGRRMSWNQFWFQNKNDALLFILRWS
jgi:hypothetical protein